MNADVECGRCSPETGGQMNAIDVAIVSFRENDAIERLVKLQKNFHSFFLAFHVQRNNFWCVGHGRCPQFVCRRRGRQLFFVADFIRLDFAQMLSWCQMLRRQRLMLHTHVIQMRWGRRWWTMVCQMRRRRCKWLPQCEIRSIYADGCKPENRIKLENSFFSSTSSRSHTWWFQYCWLLILWFQRNLIFTLFIASSSGGGGVILIVRWYGFYNFNCIICGIDLQMATKKANKIKRKSNQVKETTSITVSSFH